MSCEDEYKEADAEAFKARYAHLPQNSEDLALRVYTSQLIGKNPHLVLHGGGNTSVKLNYQRITGEVIPVLAIKGSGWDLSNIEPQGFPLVDLNRLLALRKLEKLSDEDMVNEVKGHTMDMNSPMPSIETLLHAYLPHKWVDHTHADSALAIMDQTHAAEICRKIYGNKVAIVPYIMPGFTLAKAAAEIYERDPSVEGILLLKHGVFTFGDSAKQSYQRHVMIVQAADRFIFSNPRRQLNVKPLCCCGANASGIQPSPQELFRRIAPVLRGIFREYSNRNAYWLAHLRTSPQVVEFVSSQEARDWSQLGPLTPDHVIRTKSVPLLLQDLELDDPTKLRSQIEAAVVGYMREYDSYFENFNRIFVEAGAPKRQLDKLPRVVLVQGVGIIAMDRSVGACKISADIYEHTIPIIVAAQSLGQYEPPAGQHLFDIEYWSLEQAKLGKTVPPPLQGAVVYVTGGASGIGLETSIAFSKLGASIVLTDINDQALADAAKSVKGSLGLRCNVTKVEEIQETFDRAILEFGGVDFVVSNAGGVPASVKIGDCSPQLLKEQMELNFFSHQYVASCGVRVMLAQGSDGCLLFNASKAAFNPGPKIGPYAISKAAVVALMKQYALEYGENSIRSNAVNADRVRTNLFTQEVIEARARARNTTTDEYFKQNLLGQEVTAAHVGQAFVSLALAASTTGAVITVDGGNIAASVR